MPAPVVKASNPSNSGSTTAQPTSPSSTQQQQSLTSPVRSLTSTPTTSGVRSGDITGKLKWYYSRLFPIQPFTRWLRYGSDGILSRREISFTLPGDIYVRWKSYSTETALYEALKSSAPMKLDIGAIYTVPPSDRHLISGSIVPVEKELVFDIDMTDYADVLGELKKPDDPLSECDGAWPLMAHAIDVLYTSLTQDFGFQHILCVYSGRRGVHIWVSDGRARKLTNEQRNAIADFLYLRFTDDRRASDLTVPLHPSLARARRMSELVFREFSLQQANVLEHDEDVLKLCSHISIQNGHAIAEKVCNNNNNNKGSSSISKWERMEKELTKLSKSDWSLRGAADYVVLRHTYPRLDANVTREINHLLKAPFSVHPKTGRVCVPFLPTQAHAFVPQTNAPRIDDLLSEIDAGVGPASEKMQKAVDTFKQFVDAVEKEALMDLKVEKLETVDKKNAAELLAY